MLFSEPVFFAFFAIYFLFHCLIPPRWRIYLIIVGSTVFYAWWRVEYVLLPYVLAFIAWAGVNFIERAATDAERRLRLKLILVALFAPLVLSKYSYFIANEILKPVFGSRMGDLSALKIALPLGISFITFTLTAYVVDVYRGKFRKETSLTYLLGYVLFFPHLIAGPILRPNELLPQLRQLRPALDARFALGALIFSVGLVKKLVFADTLAVAVDSVYAANANPSAWDYLLAIHGFSLQIYCDFSGYTDMAIGIAYILRIRLPTNFLRPYTATSIVDFWRRWHITLSFWLRDYLYIPLGGNRLGYVRQIVNLLITMVLGGLWHGAAWTFVIWGGVHGVGLAAVHILRSRFRRQSIVPGWLGGLLTFYFVTFAWVYFRAPNVSVAHRVLAGPFVAPWQDLTAFVYLHMFELLLLAIFFVTHRFDRHAYARVAVARCNAGIIWAVIAILFVLAITISLGSSAKFIYFDF
ncbi:MAG TPA: MBOAT family O-acyltransferase [Bradyrhizobium sp.]|nr:MBOAT family O-acyltransferase [Bradyrhizobium sp.]